MTIPELAEHENLSQPHIAKLMTIMRQAGLVRSTRGHIGGYQLARPSSEMIIGDILVALGGRVYDEHFCDRHAGLGEECVHLHGHCSLRQVWTQIQSAIDSVTNRITLEQVVHGSVPTHRNVELHPLSGRGHEVNAAEGCCIKSKVAESTNSKNN